MSVVSNTSPIRHLVLLGHPEMIGRLFGSVVVPKAVERELLDPGVPLLVRQWMSQHPVWLRVQAIEGPADDELARWLDSGEAEAIQLAQQMNADLIILDERRGREAAGARGLTVIGVLGILREAYRQRWINDPLAQLRRLRTQGFRISRSLARRFEDQIELAAIHRERSRSAEKPE
jgi:predicted nucleic acid-binding protein